MAIQYIIIYICNKTIKSCCITRVSIAFWTNVQTVETVNCNVKGMLQMKINPCDVYNQRMYEISERINARLSAMHTSQNFQIATQNVQTGTSASASTSNSSFSSVLNSVSSAKQTDTTNSAGTSKAVNLDYTGSFANSKASTFKSSYDDIISEKAKQYGVNENVVKAIIQAESDFNPNCVSSAGAKGLMQLMPCNVKDLGITNVFDPEQNIDGGIREFKGYLNSYNGDIKMALAAYNCGPTRVRNLGLTDLDDPEQFAKLPKETRNYITKIMKNLQ